MQVIKNFSERNMNTRKKKFLVEIKILDEEGKKVKGFIEEMSDSIQLGTIVETGLLLRGSMEGMSLVFELHPCRRVAVGT